MAYHVQELQQSTVSLLGTRAVDVRIAIVKTEAGVCNT